MFGKRKTPPGPGELSPATTDADAAPGTTIDLPPSSVTLPPEPTAPAGSGVEATVIGEGLELTGDIVSEGIVRIEGRIQGSVKASAITIGPHGRVTGSVDCQALHVHGHFSGEGRCSELVLARGAQLQAKLSYRTIAVQRGAVIVGELTLT